MAEARKITLNSISLIAGQFFQRLMGLVLVIVIARSYGKTLLGQYSFIMAYITVFAMASNFGFQTLIVRDIAKDRNSAKNIFPNVAVIQFLFGLFLLVPMIWFLKMTGKELSLATVLLFAFSLVFMENAINAAASILEAMDKMYINAIFLFFKRAFITLLVIAFVFFKKLDLVTLGFTVFSASFFSLPAYLLILKKEGCLDNFYVQIGFLKDLIRAAFPFFILKGVIIMFNRVDILMLSYLRGDEEVGIYSAAYYIVESLMVMADSFAIAFFPTMVQNLKESREKLIALYDKAFKLLFLMGLFLAGFISMTGQKTVLLFYGAKFQQSGVILTVLVWALLFFSMNLPSSRLLIGMDKKWTLISIFGCGLLINIGMNFLLIPRMGAIGAAAANVFSIFFVFAVTLGYVNARLFNVRLVKNCTKPVVSIGLVMLAVRFADNWNIAALIFLSFLLYSGFLYLFKVLGAEDIEFFKGLMLKRRCPQISCSPNE